MRVKILDDDDSSEQQTAPVDDDFSDEDSSDEPSGEESYCDEELSEDEYDLPITMDPEYDSSNGETSDEDLSLADSEKSDMETAFESEGEKDDTAPRTIVFKAKYWNYKETEEEPHELFLHVGGNTATGEKVHLIIKNFRPFVFLELSTTRSWNKSRCNSLITHFKNTMRSLAPTAHSLEQKYKLKYRKLCKTIRFEFPNQKAAQIFGSKVRSAKGFVVDGVGFIRPGELVVHETNVDPIISYTASRNLQLAGWLEVKETIDFSDQGSTPEDRKFTNADIDLYADYRDVSPFTPKEMVVVPAKELSFDIECKSKNHNSRLPDPEQPENEVFQIANTVTMMGSGVYEHTLFSLGNPHDMPNIKVVRCKNEKELLLKWSDSIREENPDFLIGYNTMKFDYSYMIRRAELLGIYRRFAKFSRIIGELAELKKTAWSSSAYGEQEFRYLDACGITNVDVLLEIERNHRLPKYTLDAVSEYFLKEHKDDITPRQLFMLHDLTFITGVQYINDLPPGLVPKKKRIEIKRAIQKVLPLRRCHGVVTDLRAKLMKAGTAEEFKYLVREALTLTGRYNVQDTILPIRLCDKLNLITTMEETSNCMNVPMSYLHTRGQQIKVLAQIYRETLKDDIIIEYQVKDPNAIAQKYQGAFVVEAVSGDHDNVDCFDFESLYPSVIIAKNICYTTLLPEDDPTPDVECNIIIDNSHVGCEHDPLKRKKKKEDVMCKNSTYRFRKVIIHPDGTREHEGIMPRLERYLLSNRKIVKKEMAKLQAKYDMATGKASVKDIAFFTKMGWEIIEKDSIPKKQLDVLAVCITVLNAQQLALKIGSNSCYGSMGAQNGFAPLVEGAAAVTATGRELITEAIRWILEKYPGEAKEGFPNNDYRKAVLVYGDTDSSMIKFIGLTTVESYAMGQKVSREASHHLKCYLQGIPSTYTITVPDSYTESGVYTLDKYPRDKLEGLTDEQKIIIHTYDANPVNLQFENLYARYLLLSKKRYLALIANSEGVIINKTKKGVVQARRDNSLYLRDTYGMLVESILERMSESEFMYILYDRVHKLFTRQIPDANLIIYMAIKTLQNYAKKKEKKQGRTVLSRVFVDCNDDPIDESTLIGPLDPRLIYPNIPQVLLTLKMMKRGDEVPPNTRLEFLYLENPKAEHQGEKAEDYTYYRENKLEYGFRPDYLHYVEKQLMNPIMELIHVKYPRQMVPYEKLDASIERLILELEEILRHGVLQTKTYERKIPEPDFSTRVGWCMVCKKCRTLFPERCRKHPIPPREEKKKKHTYKKLDAQVQYILDSVDRKKKDPKAKREIDEARYPELVRACRLWKARAIVDALHKKFGIRKRTVKRPTQTGEKLRLTKEGEPISVILTKKYKSYQKGTVVLLRGIVEEANHLSAVKNKKLYLYTIETPDKKLHERVPRDTFTTWYYKDGTVMKDILLYRGSYKVVVEELKRLFNPIVYQGKELEPIKLFEVTDDALDE